jgi:hypothetical protein
VTRLTIASVMMVLCLAIPADARVDPRDLSDDRSEQELLRSMHGLAQRGEGVLVLYLANGKTMEVRDGRDCRGDDPDNDEMRCVTHRLIAHFVDHHYFLVRNDHWVTYNYSWIDDRSGAAVEIEDLPHFSPDGTRFVVTKPNQMPGFNGIQLWRLKGETPALEFQYSPRHFALFDFHAWDNDTDALLDMTVYVDRQPVVRPAHLVRRTDGWQVVEPP